MADDTAFDMLWERVRGGDKTAVNELYSRYSKRVVGVAKAKLGSAIWQKTGCEDIAQSAMIKSLKTVGNRSFKTEDAFMNWMRRIVENRIRDKIRFYKRGLRDIRREISLQIQGSAGSSNRRDLPAADVSTPSKKLSRKEDKELVLKALDRLPEKARELILARDIQELTWQELADKAGVNKETIRGRYNRAMESLKKECVRLRAREGGR